MEKTKRITAKELKTYYNKFNMKPTKAQIGLEEGDTACCALGILYRFLYNDIPSGLIYVIKRLSEEHGYNRFYLSGFFQGWDGYCIPPSDSSSFELEKYSQGNEDGKKAWQKLKELQ